MCTTSKEYNRATYAGFVFETEANQLKQKKKHDDSKFRYDVLDENGDLEKHYATILRIFEHTMYPGGPTKLVFEGKWYKVVEQCPITGYNVVTHDPTFYPTFAFVQTCYQQPVALWPRAPKGWFRNHTNRHLYDVMDYNGDEQ